eukprot:TRINITY_DN475_c0_g1::TRINITY_DN475_c0_g1_i1::g.2601::m.2601 TRINITY_DN475_c0_g1::TRINITY_DN475_c0_g1_i1::g.2601  ORF type:complete len:568 (-),score=194.45,sp/A7SDW5/EIF3L_NEMVE/50.20/2e-171,Paf67/PF10255.4/6.7e-148,TPR_2/PF07719.12/2.2e+03,TPR_2/PF07719.12/0.056,TPR_1/PF00515.23/3.1e+03,TPR_1/PF00515.23/0.14 TRINITY_DN475_c0_g1_i1:319-2022(-)
MSAMFDDYVEEDLIVSHADLPRYSNDQNYEFDLAAVSDFVVYFQKCIREGNIEEVFNCYDNYYNQITEHNFRDRPWPSADDIAGLVGGDTVFLILYKEIFYRHIYSKLNPSLAQRVESWDNYCDLFNLLLTNDPSIGGLDLPSQWLWDIIDEFIYQFQSFCYYRSMLKNKGQEEISYLDQNQQIWSVQTVLQYLHALITKSNILTYLEREKNGEPNEDSYEFPSTREEGESWDYSRNNVYRMLGYFSIIGLLRMHCMLGDYYLALKILEPIDLANKKGLFSLVTACHITLYYYMGFAYMMLRRYVDGIKSFSNALLYVTRTKQYLTRSYQFDVIAKKSEQMYSLLAICLALCPHRIDEGIMSAIREKFGDKFMRMQKGGEEATSVFEELFHFGCPKFLSPAPPNFAAGENSQLEAYQLQLKLFLREVSEQSLMPTIRSFLKLYTTMGVSKLADFLDTDDATVTQALLCMKHKMRQTVWTGGLATEGRLVPSTSELNFFIDDDTVHIADTQVSRRYGEFFVRHIEQFQQIIASLEDPAFHYLGASTKPMAQPKNAPPTAHRHVVPGRR